jgi:hypothetical protein
VRRALVLSLLLNFAATQQARADGAPSGREQLIGPEGDFRHFVDYCWLALGAVSAFVGHELGHVFTDVVIGKRISLVRTQTGPFPFFAIQPCCNLTPREQYVVASAGFLVQDVNSELILWIGPKLRTQRHAYLKGVLIFDVALSIGYAITGFAGIGPPQSDVNTMARALGVPPWQIGLTLIVPAIVDVYRYLVPRSVWAPWVSIQGKAMHLGLAFTF